MMMSGSNPSAFTCRAANCTASGPRHRELELARMRMDHPLSPARHLVDDTPDARNVIGVLLADEHHIMLFSREQVLDDVKKLTREVLVDEEVFHDRSCSPPTLLNRV